MRVLYAVAWACLHLQRSLFIAELAIAVAPHFTARMMLSLTVTSSHLDHVSGGSRGHVATQSDHFYHQCVGPSPDPDIEACASQKCFASPSKESSAYRDRVWCLASNFCRGVLSAQWSLRRMIVPFFSLNTKSHDLVVIVVIAIIILHLTDPDLLLEVACVVSVKKTTWA